MLHATLLLLKKSVRGPLFMPRNNSSYYKAQYFSCDTISLRTISITINCEKHRRAIKSGRSEKHRQAIKSGRSEKHRQAIKSGRSEKHRQAIKSGRREKHRQAIKSVHGEKTPSSNAKWS